DEAGHTQHGNNNAYCQDNELTWLAWRIDPQDEQLLHFTRALIRLRREHRVFRRRRFFQNRKIHGAEVRDILWLDPTGAEMSEQQWHESSARSLAVVLAGRHFDEKDERGQKVFDSDFCFL